MENFEEWPRLARQGKFPDIQKLSKVLESGFPAERLYHLADRVRAEYTGDEVHVRGIIEFSNICEQNCQYCGIRRGNDRLDRYRMKTEEIVQVARRANGFGYGTVVLQSGEPAPFSVGKICRLIEKIKSETGLAVTLSLGVYSREIYRRFREAGADRYLLRFETSDQELFSRLHPDISFSRREEALRAIEAAGLQTGSGFMIGLPGQTRADMARDVLYTSRLDLDMIGCGPFLAAPGTPLADNERLVFEEEVYYRVMALLRILNPLAHIPATTAFDTFSGEGRDRILKQGGNVFMPNMTPRRFRRQYQLYPDKPCVDEHASNCAGCVQARLARLNRPLAPGPGHSLKKGAMKG
ncbi:MAG: [FeFe] hydrogenase H-cluster radical SAM maturase HydE [bacterium]